MGQAGKLVAAKTGRGYLGVSVDVGDIGCDTGCSSNIIESKIANFLVQLQQQTQRLSNSTY